MSSKIDINWNEETNDETGAFQAARLYEKAAGVYDDMLRCINDIQDLDDLASFQDNCGTDL